MSLSTPDVDSVQVKLKENVLSSRVYRHSSLRYVRSCNAGCRSLFVQKIASSCVERKTEFIRQIDAQWNRFLFVEQMQEATLRSRRRRCARRSRCCCRAREAGPYRSRCLQVNLRSAAFFKLYNICALLHRSKLIFLTTKWVQKSAMLVKCQQTFWKFCRICQSRKFPKF